MTRCRARASGVSHRYGRTVALDDVTLEIPARCMVGLIGPDGVGKSTLLALIAGVRRIQEGEVFALDGDMRRPGASPLEPASHRLHAAGPRAQPVPDPDACSRISTSSAACSTNPRAERERRINGTARRDRSRSVSRPAGRQAVGRHEAEAVAVLLADPRSGPLDPRRTDHGRRPAVAPAILGADRPHPRAAPGA